MSQSSIDSKLRIVIVTHTLNPPTGQSFIGEIAKCWRTLGHQIIVLKGIDTYVEADMAILHVDQTVIPEDYMAFIRQYPLVINGSVRDISKRQVSKNLLTIGDFWQGSVIVKTNQNYGGNPEKNLKKKPGQAISWLKKILNRLPYYFQSSLPINQYKVYESKALVPGLVWLNRHLVVEKFLPEIKDGLYCLRIWLFLGDKESNSICYSHSPVIKSNNIIRREPAGEVPQALRLARQELGFDYGKFDYVLVEGKPILFDANRTPSLGQFSAVEMAERFQVLSQGLHYFQKKRQSAEIWPDIAEQWSMYGPPLRPAIEDTDLFWSALTPLFQKNAPLRVLILGVTPELYHLPWPTGTQVTAVDHTQAMIDHVWPGAPEAAICAKWTAIPLMDQSFDLVLCDGGMILLNWPEEHQQFAREMRRLIAPGGLCVMRLFCPSEKREAPEAVLKDFVSGRIPSWNHLKLRLWLSMTGPLSEGLYQKAVFAAIQKAAPDLDQLAKKIQWPSIHIKLLEKTSDNKTRYFFPQVADMEELMCGLTGAFEMLSAQTHQGALAANCPVLTFRRVGSPGSPADPKDRQEAWA